MSRRDSSRFSSSLLTIPLPSQTGLRGMSGNKGGVAIRMDFHDTSLCFVTAVSSFASLRILELLADSPFFPLAFCCWTYERSREERRLLDDCFRSQVPEREDHRFSRVRLSFPLRLDVSPSFELTHSLFVATASSSGLETSTTVSILRTRMRGS